MHNPTATGPHIVHLPLVIIGPNAPPLILSVSLTLFLSSGVVHKNSVCANTSPSPFPPPFPSEKNVRNNGMVALLQAEDEGV